MTRLAVLADIHANLPALEAVIRDMETFDVDQVIVAGDSINWGPFSAQVVERITRSGWAVIRGNHEMYLLDWDTPRMPSAWNNYVLPGWLCEQLTGWWHNQIAAWPDTLSLRFPDAPPVRVVHGTPQNHWQAIYADHRDEDIIALLENVEENTVIIGHTHLAMERCAGRWQVLNPGSVGVPLDGIRRSQYMILDGHVSGWKPTFRRIPYDDSLLYAEFERQRFVERCGVTGRLVVEEFKTARIQVHAFHRWHRANYPGTPETLALVDEFLCRNVALDYVPPAYHLNLESV